MSHQLNTTDLINFESKVQLAAAFGNGQNKSLNIVSKISENNVISSIITVEKDRKVIFYTDNLEMAIIIYNNV